MSMIIRALKFVRFADVENHLRLGWMVVIPISPMHHHYYSIECAWLCNCKIPEAT